MSVTQSIPTRTTASSTKMLKAMVGIGVMCALMIVLTYEGTLPIIKENRAEALEKAVFKVLPGTEKIQAFLLEENGHFIPHKGEKVEGQTVYAGYTNENELTGIAIEASGQGYADIIRILYGYDPAQEAVVGFYVLESKETPGLGDKIEKDENFLANFKALDVSLTEDKSALKNKVVPVKSGEKEHPWQVDGITGATISSRTIGNILGESTARWVPLVYGNLNDFKYEASK